MNRWALLSGSKGTGKATCLLEVVARLRARGVAVGGVLQEGLSRSDGRGAEEGPDDHREGYVAREVAGDARATVARKARAGDDAREDAQLVCSFSFDASALAEARAWVERDAQACQIVVVDEVSKLEVARGGHHDAVVAALAGPALPLLSVRADQLFAVMERFALDEPVASLELGPGADVARFVAELAAAVSGEK
ncbi:MAG: DUF2478 domain-containing protein [Deltaproteobacteria bacterium]|nr:DUF2478 domain-containing protein [Deltaproteobacteria bacterium]